jgi:hypothetical protein
MKKSDVLQAMKTHQAVAELLGISRQAVQQWPETVPLLQQYLLHERRPELFPRWMISSPERQKTAA